MLVTRESPEKKNSGNTAYIADEKRVGIIKATSGKRPATTPRIVMQRQQHSLFAPG
jgi:hypothetical protein